MIRRPFAPSTSFRPGTNRGRQLPENLTKRIAVSFVLLLLLPSALLRAHVGAHPSVHDTVAAVVERMKREVSQAELRRWTLAKAEQFLTAQEREILGTEHITFTVSVPVTLTLLRDEKLGDEPFWLKDRQFEKTAWRVTVEEDKFDVWQKEFPAGSVGLGVNSLSGAGHHYSIAVAPRNPSDKLEIKELYPGQLRLGVLKAGERPFVDREEVFKAVPEELTGRVLIQTARKWIEVGRLLNVFRFTDHPSSQQPDHIILTWSGDPRTTQTIQWRTGSKVRKGVVAYQKKSDHQHFRFRQPKYVKARTAQVLTPIVLNDPVIRWHTVELTGLEPGSTYVYSIGDGNRDGWTEMAEFTTAPDRTEPFSFIYMGDAQNGLDRWGTLVKNAFRERPDAAFYIMAGDLVNRGAERDDWDSLFHNARGIYDRRQLVPVLGNHECQGGHPTLYLKFFNLPKNGPPAVEAERAYAFEYSNALFVVLDSNLPPESQSAWLEEQLSKSKATWKFVTYHHPAYSSAPKRDNKALRQTWGPIFDKYRVDLALQGHDHAYLRTYPMKGDQRAAGAKDGTIYIVSVSGTKMYKQDPRDYTEFGMTNVATYQVLDIQISGHRLVYRAYDIDGKLRDEFVIEK